MICETENRQIIVELSTESRNARHIWNENRTRRLSVDRTSSHLIICSR